MAEKKIACGARRTLPATGLMDLLLLVCIIRIGSIHCWPAVDSALLAAHGGDEKDGNEKVEPLKSRRCSAEVRTVEAQNQVDANADADVVSAS